MSLLNFLETPALTSPLSTARQESRDVLCVCVCALCICERGNREERGRALQEQRVRVWNREWALVSAYIGGLFLNTHPLPCSLLLHFLSRSLRKPTWPSLLPAHSADSKGTERVIALRGSGTGGERSRNTEAGRETERWGAPPALVKVWNTSGIPQRKRKTQREKWTQRQTQVSSERQYEAVI